MLKGGDSNLEVKSSNFKSLQIKPLTCIKHYVRLNTSITIDCKCLNCCSFKLGKIFTSNLESQPWIQWNTANIHNFEIRQIYR